MPRHALYAGCLLSLTLAAGTVRADDPVQEPLSAFPQSTLGVRTAAGALINFKIWTADTPARQEQGLMYVRDLDDRAGMLFVFSTTERVSMWMKNTYLPLDMLFIDDKGRITFIAARATPFSLDTITAPQPTHEVLELKGGICEQLGIKVGDIVVQQLQKRARATKK
jgi:uncharacterized membrane protein (UPF0127 family)